jgi:hypothetical protein
MTNKPWTQICSACGKTIVEGETHERHRKDHYICMPCANEYKYTYLVCMPDYTWKYVNIVTRGEYIDLRSERAEELLLAELGVERKDCSTPRYGAFDPKVRCFVIESVQTWRDQVNPHWHPSMSEK